jgi:hypothetical protein
LANRAASINKLLATIARFSKSRYIIPEFPACKI